MHENPRFDVAPARSQLIPYLGNKRTVLPFSGLANLDARPILGIENLYPLKKD